MNETGEDEAWKTSHQVLDEDEGREADLDWKATGSRESTYVPNRRAVITLLEDS